jgi:uncharacterized membrane protein YbhN (UPF0104 family)
VTNADASDLIPPAGPETDAPVRGRRGIRWKAIIGLAGLVGLAIAAASTVDDVREQALPGAGPLAGAFVLQVLAVVFAARAWVALFPPDADRLGLATGLYTSQLTKYLPAGGLAQAASQVALAGSNNGMAAAALRLPLFSLCSVLAGITFGAGLALDGDVPLWARVLSVVGLGALVTLDRRILQALLRLARRFVKRLPPPEDLPSQRAIFACYGFALGNIATFAAAFVLLLGDLTDINAFGAGAALAAGWVVGYLVVPLPSGLGVREAVLVAALPSLAAGPLLAASVAHRLVGLIAEASLAGVAHTRTVLASRRAG